MRKVPGFSACSLADNSLFVGDRASNLVAVSIADAELPGSR